MFENEAKEYAEGRTKLKSLPIHEAFARGLEEGFEDGAEFGYNKANEWHYVKDGDLPKENKKYWILISDGEPKVDSWLSISWSTFYGVIAWKEIVLPKESE